MASKICGEYSCMKSCCKPESFTKERLKECAIRQLKRRFPMIKWIPTVNLNTFLYDLAGGLTVGLTAIPQSLAYAQLASMPLETGLYTTIVSGFCYFFFGTAKDVNLGPTSLISLLTGTTIDETGLYVHQLLCFFTGIILTIFAFLRLEILLNIFPVTVITGFTSAAAILIIASQIKYFFGISGLPRPFIQLVPEFFKKINTTNVWDLVGGLLVLFFLLLVQYTVPIIIGLISKRRKNHCTKIATAGLTVFSTLRAIVAIIISAGVGYYLSQAAVADAEAKSIKCPQIANITTTAEPYAANSSFAFFISPINCTNKIVKPKTEMTLTGPVPRGVPRPEVPPFNGMEISERTAQRPKEFTENSTSNSTMVIPFSTLMGKIGVEIFIIPLIAVIELLAIGRALAQRNGYTVDASQEMFACGLAHLVGAFLNAYPSSASITRSALNAQCEVKTQMCSAFTAVLVLIAAATIADSTLPYVPKSCLAAVVIAAALNMIETHMTKVIWHVNRIDIIPTAVTFIACIVLDIEYGVLLGVVFTLVFSTILSMCSIRRKIGIKDTKLASSSSTQHLLITLPEGELRYHCADAIKKLWQRTASHNGPVIIDCSTVREADFATIIAILQLTKNPPRKSSQAKSNASCLVGLHPDMLEKFRNAVAFLKIKQPGYRDVFFAVDIYAGVSLIEGLSREEPISNLSQGVSDDIEMSIHPCKSNHSFLSPENRRKSH